MSLQSTSTTHSGTSITIPSEEPPQNPDLTALLQCHLTPSVLHALSVLYPKAFLSN
jgi:hypothetical protein